MKRALCTPWFVVGLALVLTLTFVAPAAANKLKERMKARLPDIVALKSKGIIGENSKGYLEFVGKSREGVNVVKAENADRKTLYTAVAKKTGSTVALVGARAALKWKKNLGKGEYFREADGTWIQNK